jgi:MurNAc alpha-1-phosphate uridylyltransferase
MIAQSRENETPASARPTTALVLAAGLGKRMRPLTDTLPKPLIPLAGKPLIDHALDRLALAGITRAVVNVHYLADAIVRHVENRAAPKIVISDERGRLLETGGGVVKALATLGTKPFLIHNSDTVWIDRGASNITRLLDTWDGDAMDGLLLLAPTSECLGYSGKGDFDLAPDGRLSRRKPEGAAPYVFAGVSIMQPRLFAEEPEEPFSLNRIWDRCIAAGRLSGLVLDGLWMHVGTPEALQEAETAIVTNAQKGGTP